MPAEQRIFYDNMSGHSATGAAVARMPDNNSSLGGDDSSTSSLEVSDYQLQVSEYWTKKFRRDSDCEHVAAFKADNLDDIDDCIHGDNEHASVDATDCSLMNPLADQTDGEIKKSANNVKLPAKRTDNSIDSLQVSVNMEQKNVKIHSNSVPGAFPQRNSDLYRTVDMEYDESENKHMFPDDSIPDNNVKPSDRQTEMRQSQPGAFKERGPGMDGRHSPENSSDYDELLDATNDTVAALDNQGTNTNRFRSVSSESRMSSGDADINVQRQSLSPALLPCHGNIPTANVVDDAVAIPQAEKVQKVVRTKPNQILIVTFGVVTFGIMILAWRFILHPVHALIHPGDERCWKPVDEQSVALQCYCAGKISQSMDDLNEIQSFHIFKMFEILSGQGIKIPTLEEIRERPCDPGPQAMMMITTSKVVDLAEKIKVDIHPEAVTGLYAFSYLYVTMGGIDWVNSQNWFTTTAYCNWNGLTCSFMGFVSQVSFRSFGLKGSIPSEIGYLRTVEHLDFSHNDGITGTIPSQIAKMVSLHSIDLAHTQLTGTIPSELGRLERLRSIYMNSNQLTGSIPSELFMAGRGRVLEFDVSANDLTGTIPSTIGLLTDLSHFKVSNNSITGTLPWEMGELKSLELLGVANNKFSGLIPTELGMCPLLKYIALYRSGFVGSIPEELCMGSNSSDNVIQGKFRHLVIECTGKTDESDLCSCCSTNILSGAYVRVSCAESIPAHELGLVF